jgi:hypothetical protein
MTSISWAMLQVCEGAEETTELRLSVASCRKAEFSTQGAHIPGDLESKATNLNRAQYCVLHGQRHHSHIARLSAIAHPSFTV